MLNCYTHNAPQAIPITFLTPERFTGWIAEQTPFVQQWLQQQQFMAKPESVCQIPDAQGNLALVLIGQRQADEVFSIGNLPTSLPPGRYRLSEWQPLAALAWGMGAYQFTRYKTPLKTVSQLVLPDNAAAHAIQMQLAAIYLVRDLINTPTEDMGPADLAAAAEELAITHHAEFQQIIGDDLLAQNYPLIHAVGRASTRAPRLIDIRWGNPQHPKLTLVGKGVCFDSGGLDIKNAANMALMKKDMGGAAHVLGLAQLIMQSGLPVRLRVLVPAVENVIAGNAYRPGDVLRSRRGLSVEITNTDAEGRLVLADALAEAASEQPDLLIDMATLTGAARVATGPDLPGFFTDDETLANALLGTGLQQQDPVWRLPLYKPYRKMLDSQIADIANASSSPYAGATTAALFLQAFLPEKISWVHFDIMAWNVSSKPGHPEGAEAQGLRTLFAYLQQRYTHSN